MKLQLLIGAITAANVWVFSPSGVYTIPKPLQDTGAVVGKRIFYAICNTCHKDSGVALAPSLSMLQAMSARAVLFALEKGKMKLQGATLNDGQRRAVAEWVAKAKINNYSWPSSAFKAVTASSLAPQPGDYSGWGGNLEATGFKNAADAGITPANLKKLSLKWAFGFPDGTIIRSKPAIAGNWLIVGSQFGELYAIDRNTGKLGWIFHASAAIRGAIVIAPGANGRVVYFADYSTNVYAVDITSGKQIWNQRAGFDQLSSTTGSVAVSNGKVYVPISSLEVASAAYGTYPCCISSGGVVALDALTGKIAWVHRVLPPATLSGTNRKGKPTYGPSGAPVWCSPTVDRQRGLLYIGTGENYSSPSTPTSDAIQALDLHTGRVVWNFQGTTGDIYNLACPVLNNCPPTPGPDLDFGMAPILLHGPLGKDMLLAGQKSGVVYALNPSNGQIIWKTRVGKGGALGGVHWGMATDGTKLYAANADNPLALDRRDSSIHAAPGIYALDVKTGKILWYTASPPCQGEKSCMAVNSAAPAAVPGLVFAGGLDGHIRAYQSENGAIAWDYNTAVPCTTVNGVSGEGGAIDGPAPVISRGMLFVNSGYGMFGQKPGNVLLAFTVR
ncbi:MAG TPA: PQQ-binding-like beta-propeller repeat protein [Puia sp.]|nr:PQQ-binding-like beta-propeller repeat protein [Puia sp.]